MNAVAEIDLDEELFNSQQRVTDPNCTDNTFQITDSLFSLPLRITNFSSEKEQISFIKNVERVVRNSIEYKLWVSYITDTLGQNKCMLTNEKLIECDLDVHHHPLTLYTVVKSVVDDCIGKEEKFSTFDISIKVMELHYQNKVGYMVLLSNMHKKYHNGFQKLPIEFVHGDFRYLLNNYHIDEEERIMINELCNIKIPDCKITWSNNSYPGLILLDDSK